MSDLEYNLKMIKQAKDQKLPPLVSEEEIENKLYQSHPKESVWDQPPIPSFPTILQDVLQFN